MSRMVCFNKKRRTGIPTRRSYDGCFFSLKFVLFIASLPMVI